jgi:hypothetical protein
MNKNWQKSPEFVSWLRAPAAEKFLEHARANAHASLRGLIGAASVSPDPAVRAAHAKWFEHDQLATFLVNSRKESATDDD